MRFCRLTAIVLTICALLSVSAQATTEDRAIGAVRDMAGQVDTATLVRMTTGINPDDYPCARTAILKLFDARREIESLHSWDPRRVMTWMTDQFQYYSVKLTSWLMGLFDRNTLDSGLRQATAMAEGRGGNPLAGTDRMMEGWIDNLGPRSQEVLTQQISTLIAKASGPDGICN